LERVALHRHEYGDRRAAALREERAQRHANGEVYFASCWIPRSEAGKIVQGFQGREFVVFFETMVLLAALLGIAGGLTLLFAFLFLP